MPPYCALAPTPLWLERVRLDQQFSKMLGEFYAMVAAEGAGSHEALSRLLLLHADNLMAVLKSPQRIGAKADSAAMRALYLDADREQRVRMEFRDPDKLPKLLTGYDAPVAYTIYLDKPLRTIRCCTSLTRPCASRLCS